MDPNRKKSVLNQALDILTQLEFLETGTKTEALLKTNY